MNAVKTPPLKDKQALRAFFTEKRRILAKDRERKRQLDMEIQSRLILSPEYRSADALLLYAARDFEVATLSILYAALANGKTVAYPRCEEGGEMIFCAVTSPADLIPGRFGILVPRQDCPVFIPDERTLCVCPALCCDMSGYRLGFGGGYYDRFLSGFGGVSAALCYSEALIPMLVHNDHDIPMRLIVTDSFIRHIQSADALSPETKLR